MFRNALNMITLQKDRHDSVRDQKPKCPSKRTKYTNSNTMKGQILSSCREKASPSSPYCFLARFVRLLVFFEVSSFFMKENKLWSQQCFIIIRWISRAFSRICFSFESLIYIFFCTTRYPKWFHPGFVASFKSKFNRYNDKNMKSLLFLLLLSIGALPWFLAFMHRICSSFQ